MDLLPQKKLIKCLALVFISKAPVVLLDRCMATAKGYFMYKMQSNRLDSPRSRERALLARKEAVLGVEVTIRKATAQIRENCKP